MSSTNAQTGLTVDIIRLSRELESLAGFSDSPAPGSPTGDGFACVGVEAPAVTRIVFSETDRRARHYFKELCASADLIVREDAVGNTFARWIGQEPNLAPIGAGSHIDAIPNAGRYDGTVGVLGGLEAIRALRRAGFHPRRSIELVLFTSEEPTRFGIGCLGSRLLSGSLAPQEAATLRDKEGKSLDEWRIAAGFHGQLTTVLLPRGHYAGFVELHIEQGPVLEQHGTAVGIVTAIAAPASLRIWIEGEGGHAGAVLMPERRDALCAAAELTLAVEAAARGAGAADTVGTTGICDVFPGAINSIPARVRLEIDVRDTDQRRRDSVLQQIQTSCAEIAARRRVQVRTEIINADPPAQCDPGIVSALSRAAARHGLASESCRGGYSHRPDEYASPEAISNGVLVLADVLAELANS